jgi:hypothetical protein
MARGQWVKKERRISRRAGRWSVKKERVMEKLWFPRTATSNKQCLYLFGEKGTCDRGEKAVASTNSDK